MNRHLYSPESAVVYKLNYFPHLLSCLLYHVFYYFFNASLYLTYDVQCLNSIWWWVCTCIYFVNNCSFVLCFVDFLIKSSFTKKVEICTVSNIIKCIRMCKCVYNYIVYSDMAKFVLC